MQLAEWWKESANLFQHPRIYCCFQPTPREHARHSSTRQARPIQDAKFSCFCKYVLKSIKKISVFYFVFKCPTYELAWASPCNIHLEHSKIKHLSILIVRELVSPLSTEIYLLDLWNVKQDYLTFAYFWFQSNKASKLFTAAVWT